MVFRLALHERNEMATTCYQHLMLRQISDSGRHETLTRGIDHRVVVVNKHLATKSLLESSRKCRWIAIRPRQRVFIPPFHVRFPRITSFVS